MPPKFAVKFQVVKKAPEEPKGQLDALPQPFTGTPETPKLTGLLALAASKAKPGQKPSGKAVAAPEAPPKPSGFVTLAKAKPAPKPATAAPKPAAAASKPAVTFAKPTATTAVKPKPVLQYAPSVKLPGWEDYNNFYSLEDINYWIETEYSDFVGKDEDNEDLGGLDSKLFGAPFGTYKRIRTAGRGTCLIHAILTCVSEVYRKIPVDTKSKGSKITVREEIGSIFRTQILPFLEIDNEDLEKVPLFSKEDKQQPWYQDICQIKLDYSSGTYLTDTVGYRLSKYFGVNLAFFNQIGAEGQQIGQIIPPATMNEEQAWIFVYNITETHYEAIQMPNGEFRLESEEAVPLIETYGGADKAKQRRGIPLQGQTECKYNIGDTVEYEGLEYIVVENEYYSFPGEGKKESVCVRIWLMPKALGEEVVNQYQIARQENRNDTRREERRTTLLTEQDGKLVEADVDDDTQTVTWPPKLKKVGESAPTVSFDSSPEMSPEAVAPSQPRTKRLLKSVKENLRNWVTKLGDQSEIVEFQEDVKQQENAYSAYTVDVPDNQYPMSEQKTFYQFIASQFGVFKLPPISVEINEEACQALKVSPELTLYQKFIREYMRSISPYRGILVYHGLGSGKTCTAIAAAESLYNSDPGRKIVVLTPSSLQENFVNELSFCGFKHYRLQNHWVPFEVTPALRQYAVEVMKIPVGYFGSMDAAAKKAKDAGEPYTKQIWIPDFEQAPNFDELDSTDQAQIRRQIRETVKGNILFIGYTGIGKEKLSKYLQEGVFNNAVIVIDEVHNLTRLMDNKLTKYLVAPKGKESKSYEPIPANPTVGLAKGSLEELKARVQAEGKKKQLSDEVIKQLLKEAVQDYYDRAYLFYRIFAEAKNSKLIALSGTPIVNYPTEFAICLNFLHGYFYTCSFTIQSSTKQVEDKVRDYCRQHPKIGFFEVSPKRDTIQVFITLIRDGYSKILNDKNEVVGVEKTLSTQDYKDLEEDVFITEAELRKANPSIQDLFAEFVENFQEGEDLKGKIDQKADFQALSLFPVDRETFTEQFVDINEETANFSLKADMKVKFARRLAGLVSYYKGAKKDYMPSFDSYVVNCVMSSRQLKEYNDVRTSELKEKKSKAGKFIDSDDLKEQQSSYRFASRSASNFAFPESIPRPRPGIRDLLIMDAEGAVYSEGNDLANETPESLAARQAAEEAKKKVEQEEQGDQGDDEGEAEGEADGGDEGDQDEGEGQTGGMNGTTDIKLKKKFKSAKPQETAKPQEAAKAKEEEDDPTKSYSEKVVKALEALRARKAQLFSMNESDPEKQRLSFYSKKFYTMITNILAKKTYGPVETDVSSLVYSAFKTVEGLGVFSIALEAQGFVQIKLAGTDKNPVLHEDTIASFANREHDGKRYILYTGDYSPFQRQVLLNIFNCNKEKLGGAFQAALQPFSDNQTGQLCRVFMITGAGAEGLSLKNVRRVHIMEPYWNKVRTDQVQGRAIRICSHMDLPYDRNPELNQRHVDVYTYISVFPENAAATLNETIKTRDVFNGRIYSTDQFINELAGRKDTLSKDFLETAQQMAVDCTLNVTENEVQCAGVSLAQQTDAETFFYDPRLEKDLGKAESIVLKKTEETAVEKAKGIKVVLKGKDQQLKKIWIVKRSEAGALVYDLYDETNTSMQKKLKTLTQAQYDTFFAKKT